MKEFVGITDEDWRRYFEVNVLSGARLARAYFPGMLERNWGRIIFISSESGFVTPGQMIHYGMTKTAQFAISRGLAELTKGTKVTVNSVLPGPTRSEGIVDFLKSLASDPAAPPEQIEAEFFAKGRPSSLLQRMIEPDEIANLVAYRGKPAVFSHQWCCASRRRRRHAYDRLGRTLGRGSRPGFLPSGTRQ